MIYRQTTYNETEMENFSKFFSSSTFLLFLSSVKMKRRLIQSNTFLAHTTGTWRNGKRIFRSDGCTLRRIRWPVRL